MTDEEAADFYANPANAGFDPSRVVRRRPLGDSIPVRFPAGMVEQVKQVAAGEDMTVSEWVRQAVADTLAQRSQTGEDPTAIARELERLARKLRRTACGTPQLPGRHTI